MLPDSANFASFGRLARCSIVEGTGGSYCHLLPFMRSPKKLPNYLRSHRKRSGLSQDDVAMLLGDQSGAKVCRLERFRRQPTLRTALAFEAIYRVPVRELFAGQFQEVKREVHRRAEELTCTLGAAHQARGTARRLDALKKIALTTDLP
ncbi:MAG: helix-turn-helix transcriptional regulator [Limisphaerales bacterium]